MSFSIKQAPVSLTNVKNYNNIKTNKINYNIDNKSYTTNEQNYEKQYDSSVNITKKTSASDPTAAQGKTIISQGSTATSNAYQATQINTSNATSASDPTAAQGKTIISQGSTATSNAYQATQINTSNATSASDPTAAQGKTIISQGSTATSNAYQATQIGYPISDDPMTLGEFLSNVVMMYSAAAQGLGNFSEAVMDAGLTLVEIPVGGITYGIDSIFGTDLNSITIGAIDDFIETEHVNSLFEYVHTKTPFSVFSENATEGLKYGGEVYTVTSGAANITAKIAAVVLLSPYIGPAGAGFLVGGVTGMGEYREDALQNGADTIPSMVAAFAGGNWEGLQWGLGGKLSGTGVVAILSDGTTGALDTPIRSYIISTASGKDFNEVFEQYGGTGSMFLGGTFGTIFSSLGEISDIFTKGQNINVSHKNMPDDALGISLNPAPTSQQFMQQVNIDDNIQKLRDLMNDSNIVNGYSDYLLTTKNEYARLWDEFDIGRRELQQTYQTVFKDSGFEDAVSYLDQFGLSKGQGNNYGVRVIEHYIKTGDSSVFPREYGLRNYFTSYRTADLADMLELDNAYRNISSGNLIMTPLGSGNNLGIDSSSVREDIAKLNDMFSGRKAYLSTEVVPAYRQVITDDLSNAFAIMNNSRFNGYYNFKQQFPELANQLSARDYEILFNIYRKFQQGYRQTIYMNPSTYSNPNLQPLLYDIFDYSDAGLTVAVRSGFNCRNYKSQDVFNVLDNIKSKYPEMLNSTDEIIINDFPNPDDLYWSTVHKNNNFKSTATAGNRTINVYQYATTSGLETTISHEIGHNIDNNGGFSNLLEWKTAADLDGKFTTPYAKEAFIHRQNNRYSEDFAESIALLETKGANWFAEHFPNRATILKMQVPYFFK